LDDVVLRTPPSVADKARAVAVEEIEEVLAEFRKYMDGKKGPWLVPSDQLDGRLDAKFLRPWRASDLLPKWNRIGAISESLTNLVESTWSPVRLEPNKEYKFLQVTYSGHAQLGETRLGREVSYKKVRSALAGDIVISNLGAVYRAICVLPKWAENMLISSEFTVLRIKNKKIVDAAYLRAILRSSAIIAEWLSGATGVGRHRVDWNRLKHQQIPLLSLKDQRAIGNFHRKAERYETKIADLESSVLKALAPLELEGELATDRLARAKPPK
jgi:hypothetical protein